MFERPDEAVVRERMVGTLHLVSVSKTPRTLSVWLRVAMFAVLVLAGSCNAFAQEREPVITLRRTACLGWCPVYSLEIFDDGFIRYVGTEFVQYRGERRAIIRRDAVENLVALFLRADYFGLKDNYETYRAPDGTVWHVTDLPTAYTSLRIGTRKKSVRDYAFAPKRLTELEDEIDKVVNTKRWIGSALLNVPAPNL
jgi:hypothetical protein